MTKKTSNIASIDDLIDNINFEVCQFIKNDEFTPRYNSYNFNHFIGHVDSIYPLNISPITKYDFYQLLHRLLSTVFTHQIDKIKLITITKDPNINNNFYRLARALLNNILVR